MKIGDQHDAIVKDSQKQEFMNTIFSGYSLSDSC